MNLGLLGILILAGATTAINTPPEHAKEDAGNEVSAPTSRQQIQVGKPGNIVLLNRSKDAGHHETFFFPDPTCRSGVVVFDDDALGITIGIVMTDNRESNDFEKGSPRSQALPGNACGDALRREGTRRDEAPSG